MSDEKIDALTQAIERVDLNMREMRLEMRSTKNELKAEIQTSKEELRQELKADIAATKEELAGEISASRVELRVEMHTGFSKISRRLTKVEKKIDGITSLLLASEKASGLLTDRVTRLERRNKKT